MKRRATTRIMPAMRLLCDLPMPLMRRSFTSPRSPARAPPRYEFEFGLDGLRGWPLRGFPYLAFYVEGPDQIEVWRVLHAERGLTAELGDAGADSES